MTEKRLDFVTACSECGQPRVGVLIFDRMTVTDSLGGMLFDNGFVCDGCLGEG